MGSYPVISSDDHVMEPEDLWTSRIEPKYMERAPQVVSLEDGDFWYCDGLRILGVQGATQTGQRFEGNEKLSFKARFENVRPGAYIPEEHVKDMAIDGVDVSIVYPTCGLGLYGVPDGKLLSRVFQVYNDWIAEYANACPQQLKGVGMINLDDVQEAVRELERCAKIGLVGVMIPVYPPEDRAYDSLEYEPFWAASGGLGIPLSLHVITNRGQNLAVDTAKASYVANLDHWVRISLADMIFSGVFERHPKLQVGAVEQESGWIPHFLERMDYTYTQRARKDDWHRFKEDLLPSDYFHRHVFVGFQEDAIGIRDRHIIGVDNLQWGSDYPHTESTFPRSREILEEILADCTEEEKAKITGGNAARVYNLG